MCDHGRQASIIPVIKQLIKFFLSPGRRTLRTEIVKDKERSFTDLVKPFVIRGQTIRAIGASKVVEQIWNHNK